MDHNAIDMDQMGFSMAPPPPLQHPPPQIFGSYLLDGLPDLQQLPSDYAAHMFPDHILMDEGAEAKKRRISRACDMCRKKKIKCDGKLPSCTHCINYKTQCVFTQTEKKRTPPKGAKYIEGLENRLGRMEHLLRLSGLLDEDEDDLGALEKRLMEKSRQESLVQTPDLSWPSRETPAQDASDSPRSCLMSSGAANRDDDQGGDEDGDRDKDKDRGRGKDRDKGYGERERQTEKEGVRERPREREREREMERGRDGSRPKLAGPSVERQEEEQEVETLSEMMCSLVTNQSGDSRYIGSSSGFSIFSPKGVQWVNSKTGDDSFRNMISHVSEDDHKWTNWKPEVFGDVFERRIFRPLPGREEALRLLGDYFDNFNCMMPLFHQPTFMQLVERQYSADPYQGTGWWASLNATLAIAHRLRVMSGLDPAEEDDKGWGYLKNAMACFAELTMRNTDLLSVQALLGMALFLQGTPNPQPTSRLIAAAMRLSHSIGLHRRGTGFDLNPIEIEQRQRVFWIGYMLDKDLSLRSGQPPAQEDDDMSVELPDAEAPDGIGIIPLADGKGQMSLFRVLCEFAVIESSVYKRLYSAKASRQSDGELLSTIGELDQQLEEWKDRIPVEFRPEHPIQASHTPLILHVVMLHFAYYNCLTTIHRMSVQHGIWTSRLANYAIQGLNVRPLNPRIFSSAALCTSAARASISLLKYIPQGDFSCVWMIIYFPISALVVLFGNILQSPLNAKARSDVKLMKLVVTFLSMLGQEAEQGGVHRMLGVCSEFCRVAESVIDKADKEQAARRKRKNPDSSQSKTAPMVPSQTPQPTARASPFVPMRSVSGASSPPGMDVGWVHPQQVLLQQPQPQQYGMGMDSAHSSPMSGIHVLQQPLIPPNLFSLQMSLDWTWAEMSGGAYPSVENGNPSLFE